MNRSELQKIGAKIPRDKLAQYRIPWWIDPRGKAVRLTDKDHALSAIEMLKKRAVEAGPEKAIGTLINEGWIRVQVYPDETAFVQGAFQTLLKHGGTILKIVPALKSVEIGYVPADYKQPPTMTRKEIDCMGWQDAVRQAKRGGKSGGKARI